MDFYVNRKELKEVMYHKHITQENLAMLLNITRVSLNAKLSETNPSFFNEREIARLRFLFGKSIFFEKK